MSIIFDALKRAEALRQKGQAPTLATSVARSKTSASRTIILVIVFVLAGIGAFFWRPASDSPATNVSDTRGATAARGVVDQATPALADANPQVLTEQAMPESAPVVQTDLTSKQSATSEPALGKVSGLSMPTLDAPLTGAAQTQSDSSSFAANPIASQVPSPEIANQMPSGRIDGAPTNAFAPPAARSDQPAQSPQAEIAQSAPSPAEQDPAASTGSQAQTAIAPAISAPQLPTVFELDYSVRYELPKMAVSMYVFNTDPQYRFVIIGGKKYRQGEQVDAKVTLTEIRSDGIVCDYQGTQFLYPRQSL